MNDTMRQVSQAAVDLWGIEDQVLMVAEEAVELAHAVLKWRRAWKKYNKTGISLIREDTLEAKAYQRALEKRVKAVQKESMQMLFMIDQLQVMLPGDYEDILDHVLADAVILLQNRGVDI